MIKIENVLPLLPATAPQVAAKLGLERQKVAQYLVHAVKDGRLRRDGFAPEVCGNRTLQVSVYAPPDPDRPNMREVLVKRQEAITRLYGLDWLRPMKPVLSDRHVGHVVTRTHVLEGAYERDEGDDE